MRFLHRLRRAAHVTFCDSCAQVCDATCRTAAIRDRARQAHHTAGFPRF